MKIRIGDFPLSKDERDAIQRVMDSGRITEHKEVRAFEEEFAEWIGARYCVALSSGTAALMTGLAALTHDGVRNNARVLIPALTFIATANAVKLSGMEPVFGDVDPLTMCLSHKQVSFGVDVVMPVHLFGYMPNMQAVQQKAQRARAVLVEDACEAHGSIQEGKKAGTFGKWAAFSFYIAHTIQAGELGALVTNDKKIAGLARSIKAHGRECRCKVCTRSTGKCPNMSEHDPRYFHTIFGYNFKPMEFSAALARVQLAKSKQNLDKRYRNAVRLSRGLRKLERVLVLPHLNRNVSYMMYPIILRRPGLRHKLLLALEERNVECRPLFGCIPLQQPAYTYLYSQYRSKLPISKYYGANGFFVGCHQYLTDGQIDYMIRSITDAIEEIS